MKAALLSRWHVHAAANDGRYVKEFLSHPENKVVCVWDKNAETASEWGREFDCDWETDLEAVLSRSDVEGVIVTSEPALHKEIFIAAAQHKKHIFTQKVLSFTLEDAYAIRDAIKKNGVKFCISFMRLSIPQFSYAKELTESGKLGDPVMFRCLCGHNGGLNGSLPEYWFDPKICGGGAMIDLGFNSAYLARYIMGDFESVSSSFEYYLHRKVEDNASCNVRFKSGAMGCLEASFTSPLMSVFELSVYGTKGAYYARFGGGDTAQIRLEGKPLETIPLNLLPAAVPTPMQTWIDACTLGAADDLYGIDAAVELVKYMIAAYNSALFEGKRVLL